MHVQIHTEIEKYNDHPHNTGIMQNPDIFIMRFRNIFGTNMTGDIHYSKLYTRQILDFLFWHTNFQNHNLKVESNRCFLNQMDTSLIQLELSVSLNLHWKFNFDF